MPSSNCVFSRSRLSDAGPPTCRPTPTAAHPEPFEGVVVQVGSGYAGIDAGTAFLRVRLADHTERQALLTDTELMP
ncbi:hypothetical protein [Streptomyces fuscichromogenes]|uniref:hypothetical protein n=1 Tax=Streptomyces fuscichromogenes TaxID=1324013 RepID=UPI0016711CA8|nr:hypothetical protein [Streptomyces fuscichromogenes]